MSEDVVSIKKCENNVLWTYVIEKINGEEIARMLYKKE